MVTHDVRIREGASQTSQLLRLRVILVGVEAEPEVDELAEALAKRGIAVELTVASLRDGMDALELAPDR